MPQDDLDGVLTRSGALKLTGALLAVDCDGLGLASRSGQGCHCLRCYDGDISSCWEKEINLALVRIVAVLLVSISAA